MKRVLVIGCGGAGKSHFSRKLSQTTKLPVIHLDKYYHVKKYAYTEIYNNQSWVDKVTKLAKKEQWIIDGNYRRSLRPRFEHADTVIFLDYPLYIRLYRIFKRHFYYLNKKRVDMPADWREKIELQFLWSVIMYSQNTKPTIVDMMDEYPHLKIITFKKPRDADIFLENNSENVKNS